MTRPVRVGPTASSALLGDAWRVLDPRIPDAPAIRPIASGLATVADTPVQVGPARRTAAGPSLVEVVVDGWRFELEVEDAERAELRGRATRIRGGSATSGPVEVRAIIPGRVAAVHVVDGDEVEAGQSLLVVEAMTMQNALRAPRAGVVERVAVAEGATIDNGDLLVVLR